MCKIVEWWFGRMCYLSLSQSLEHISYYHGGVGVCWWKEMDKDDIIYSLHHKNVCDLELFISYKVNLVFFHLTRSLQEAEWRRVWITVLRPIFLMCGTFRRCLVRWRKRCEKEGAMYVCLHISFFISLTFAGLFFFKCHSILNFWWKFSKNLGET